MDFACCPTANFLSCPPAIKRLAPIHGCFRQPANSPWDSVLHWWPSMNKFHGNHPSDPDWRPDASVKGRCPSTMVSALQFCEFTHLLSQEPVISRSETWLHLEWSSMRNNKESGIRRLHGTRGLMFFWMSLLPAADLTTEFTH